MKQLFASIFQPFSRRSAYIIPLAVFAVLTIAEIIAILRINHGRFIYSLDDPYIHLALAEHIRHGHYGVNAGEFSSPSSSVVWPFILSVFSGFWCSEYVPLAINIVCGSATVVLFSRILLHILSPKKEQTNIFFLTAVSVSVMIPSLNVIGLIFTGMEHSLQTLLAVLSIWGIIRLLDEDRFPRWLMGVLIIAPLIRYEAAALSLACIFILFICRRRITAIIVLVAIIVSLGGFSIYLHSLGLPLLPASVLSKTDSTQGIWRAVFGRAYQNIINGESYSLILCAGLTVIAGLLPSIERRKKIFVIGLTFTAVITLIFGRFGWYFRYEIAAMTTALFGLIYFYGEKIKHYAESLVSLPLITVFCILVGFAVFHQYWTTIATTPLAANNIYEQQYQTSRFISEYYREPIAVNDIGLPTYRSGGIYVLDLWGLSSVAALNARFSQSNPMWMDSLANQYSVRAAIIYPAWFPDLPPNWQPIAKMRINGKLISAAENTVQFYALDDETVRELTLLLTRFADELPPGVRLDILPRPPENVP